MVTIGRLSEFPDRRWNDFVMDHAHATCFHLSEWAEVSISLCGWEPYYLFVEDDSNIRAVLPLVHVKNRFGRGALVSTPFCVYGGVLAEDVSTRQMLENAAAKLARNIGVAHLEVRQAVEPNPQWTTTDLYFTFKKQLLEEADANLTAIPRKQRAMVRKGSNAGLTATFGRDLDTFYDLFAVSMRNLGTPVYPRELFTTLARIFGEKLDVLLVERRGRPLAAVLSLYFRDEVLPYYAGGVPDARAFAAFDYMYWELMRHAAKKGARQFDFGRSMRGSGAFAFKKNWGFEPQPLQYQYDVIHGSGLPVKDPDQPRYKALIAIWRHLPLSLANSIGPAISRQLY